jgi:LacI family transcriptional regulator
VTGRRIEPRPSIGRSLGVPVVYAMTQSLDTDEPAILPDDQGGGEMAARHLMEGGRTRLGHITGPERFLAARRRAGGFCATAATAGVRFSPSDVLYGEWSERWGREGARILLASNPGVQAIFCGSDRSAAACPTPCGSLATGFPTTSRWSASTTGTPWWPAPSPLSSIDMCLVDVGGPRPSTCCRRSAPPTFGSHIVPCRLVVRGSSGPPAARRTGPPVLTRAAERPSRRALAPPARLPRPWARAPRHYRASSTPAAAPVPQTA